MTMMPLEAMIRIQKTMTRMYQGVLAGENVTLVGDHIGKRLMRVVTVVQRHSAIATLVGQLLKAGDDPFLKNLKLCLTQAATRMNVVTKLMDRLGTEEAVDQAIEEGGDSSATVRHRYWETVEEVIDNIGMYKTGVDEYGLAPGSKEQMQLLAVVDYNDEIFNGAHLFNMCTSCGLAFGGKLWWNRDVGTHYSGLQLMHLEINEEAFKKKVSKRLSRCVATTVSVREASPPSRSVSIHVMSYLSCRVRRYVGRCGVSWRCAAQPSVARCELSRCATVWRGAARRSPAPPPRH